jgi:hypothetical protein
MSDDDTLRLAVQAVGTSLLVLVIQQARSRLEAKKAQTGRGLTERLGYRLGNLWARRYRKR